ncbi:MAG: uncharacterized protein A8A55_2930 [Amphiamblys sp. WSBS2006]|nr:MAG: uncharacterized protein A8A55_2930 [Amphiamblys sp. WSBS2006]
MREAFLNRLTAQLTTHTPSEFLLATTNIPNRPTLLTKKTTVSLENIAVSEALFSVLLSKTKVRVGENFSLFGHSNVEDCIKEHGVERKPPVLLKKIQNELITPLFLENIGSIPPNSIGCALGSSSCWFSVLFLSKLRIGEDSNIIGLSLEEENEKHTREILNMEDGSISVGNPEEIGLYTYAVNILPKLAFHEDNKTLSLVLSAAGEEHITAILGTENGSIFVGNPEKIKLYKCAVNILHKLKFHEDNKTLSLVLYAAREEHITAILGTENESIFVGNPKEIILNYYAVNILSKLALHSDNRTLSLVLYAAREEHITAILGTENGSIFVGKPKEIILEDYAVNILPKLKFHNESDLFDLFLSGAIKDNNREIPVMGDGSFFVWKGETIRIEDGLLKINFQEVNEILDLVLSARGENYIRQILGMEDGSIFVGNPEKIRLYKYAVNILPKLKFHDESDLFNLVLSADQEEHITAILGMEDGSFVVKKAETITLEKYAVNILPKLKFHDESDLFNLILSADQEEHIAPILTREHTFSPGKIKEMVLNEYAVFIVAKMDMKGENSPRSLTMSMENPPRSGMFRAYENNIFLGEIEELVFEGYALELLTKLRTRKEKGIRAICLRASKEAHITRTLEKLDKRIDIGKVSTMKLLGYAVNVLPRLEMGENDEMERFFVWKYGEKDSMTSILSMEDGSIEIGRIKRKGFDVPEEIKPKLKYILVDEENPKKRSFPSRVFKKICGCGRS